MPMQAGMMDANLFPSPPILPPLTGGQVEVAGVHHPSHPTLEPPYHSTEVHPSRNTSHHQQGEDSFGNRCVQVRGDQPRYLHPATWPDS